MTVAVRSGPIKMQIHLPILSIFLYIHNRSIRSDVTETFNAGTNCRFVLLYKTWSILSFLCSRTFVDITIISNKTSCLYSSFLLPLIPVVMLLFSHPEIIPPFQLYKYNPDIKFVNLLCRWYRHRKNDLNDTHHSHCCHQQLVWLPNASIKMQWEIDCL